MTDQNTLLASASPFIGTEVELPQMLNARERRVLIQKKLLASYQKPLISFTLNIPGPVKVLPHVPEAFVRGISLIEDGLENRGFRTIHREILLDATGLEAFWAVDADVQEIKAPMVSIEDGSALGRLFDIDVIGPDGSKVSREELGLPPRTCLLCGRPAHACARSRNHTVSQLADKIETILRKEFMQHGI